MHPEIFYDENLNFSVLNLNFSLKKNQIFSLNATYKFSMKKTLNIS